MEENCQRQAAGLCSTTAPRVPGGAALRPLLLEPFKSATFRDIALDSAQVRLWIPVWWGVGGSAVMWRSRNQEPSWLELLCSGREEETAGFPGNSNIMK